MPALLQAMIPDSHKSGHGMAKTEKGGRGEGRGLGLFPRGGGVWEPAAWCHPRSTAFTFRRADHSRNTEVV